MKGNLRECRKANGSVEGILGEVMLAVLVL